MDFSHVSTIRLACADLNGIWRGKRLASAQAGKLESGGVRMPFSALNVDIFGRDIEDSPLVFESGDADGVLLPTNRGAVPMPWLGAPTALIPMMMYHEDGKPFLGDPRQALVAVLDRFAARGWQVMAGTEMEFCLIDDSDDAPCPPANPLTGRPLAHQEVLSLAELDAFDAFFTELYDGCAAMGIPAQAAISESGLGQFEVNLNHQNALRAADDAVLFKSLVRGIARKHGCAASFMAKPYADEAGNGLHVHFSVVDQDGQNVFDDGGDHGTDLLRHAVAGCLVAMPASTLIFAPHANSYARLVPGAHAPTAALWGYENRTAALRIPGGSPKARRIEHRTAGGDINPYLMLATVLGAALVGIEDQMQPPAPISGDAYQVANAPQLAPDWETAITWFAQDSLMARILPTETIANLALTKGQELRSFAQLPTASHWQTLLEAV
ncbi:glutamine synthetase [Epibacterium sp. SM1979]|uniref:Glutamine synthetase n=1 Tax=Tritonibacter litoralis TaxID=2662264 RepID=A0A843YER8_9RHOB|nr:glutamine synthetase family protein [Tritonibacter litoralis]MQQ09920.1 glutamine synthetase [Tritonibacter litoralis]